MAKPHFDAYKTIIKIIHERQNLLFGICFQHPPNALLLYKEHMYSLFLLLYCYGQPEHKEIILEKLIDCKEHHISKMKDNSSQQQKIQKLPPKKLSKNIIQMLQFVQNNLKTQPQTITLHTLKQRQYIRKSFKSIFQMQNKLNLKSQMNIIDFAKLAASLIDAYCQVKDYFDFQLIQFRNDQFDGRNLDVFIQIDKKNQTYRYIKQKRNPKLIDHHDNMNQGVEYDDLEGFMFQKLRIKRAQSFEESGPINTEDDEDQDQQQIEQQVILNSQPMQSSIRLESKPSLHYKPLNQSTENKNGEPVLDLLQSLSKKCSSSRQDQPQNQPSLKTQSKSIKPPSLKFTPLSSQFKQKIKQQEQTIHGENNSEDQSQLSVTKKLDVENLLYQNFGVFTHFQKEVKDILQQITLSDFLKGFDQAKLKQMPVSFHKQLTKNFSMKFKVEDLDSAIHQLALENMSAESPLTPTENQLKIQQLKSMNSHNNLLSLIFRTLFHQQSPIHTSSKVSEPPAHNSEPHPPTKLAKKPSNPIKTIPNSLKIHKSTDIPKTNLPKSTPIQQMISSTPKKYDYNIGNIQFLPHYYTSPRIQFQPQKQFLTSQSRRTNQSGRKRKYSYLDNV